MLGVGPSSHGKPPPRDIAALDLSVLSEVEQHDLWNLVAWKREAADPLVLLELAARRFLHPDAHLSVRRYEPVTARFGSLLGQLSRTVRQSPAPAGIDAPATAQPEGEEVDGADAGSDAPAPAQPDEEQVGGTAVLGGGLLTHPRVVLLVPLDYYGDEDAQRYEKIIAILRRLFLPVHLALEVIWQNKRAALDGATYLNHPMQKARMRTERMKDEE